MINMMHIYSTDTIWLSTLILPHQCDQPLRVCPTPRGQTYSSESQSMNKKEYTGRTKVYQAEESLTKAEVLKKKGCLWNPK